VERRLWQSLDWKKKVMDRYLLWKDQQTLKDYDLYVYQSPTLYIQGIDDIEAHPTGRSLLSRSLSGTTVFELATGKILFTGKTNNQMAAFPVTEICSNVWHVWHGSCTKQPYGSGVELKTVP